MNKTTIDAVNKFKGVWPYSDSSQGMYFPMTLIVNKFFGAWEDYECNGYVKKVCTKKEFNQCVEDCSNNFGKKTKPVFTQAMVDNDELPSVGSKFLVGCEMKSDSRIADFMGLEVDVIGVNKRVITFKHCTMGFGCGVYYKRWVKPIDNRTDSEKANDLFKIYLKGEIVSTHKIFSQAVKDGDFGDNIKWSIS